MELSGELHAPTALLPVPTEYEAGWAPEPVCTRWPRRESNLDRSARRLSYHGSHGKVKRKNAPELNYHATRTYPVLN